MAPSGNYRFDGWTLHRPSGELVKGERRIRLQVQPLMILEELLAEPGALVTRERLVARLWPNGVVDYDVALNSAVRRLRRALDDCADTPRYIETLPRRGYRFIGHLDASGTAPRADSETPGLRAGPGPRRSRYRAAAALLLGIAAAATWAVSHIEVTAVRSNAVAPASNGQALEPYQRARYFFQRRAPGDLELARRYYTEALALDPGLARAWAGLADVASLESREGLLSADIAMPRVREAAERALVLDPRLAEPHLRLSGYWEWAGEPRKRDAHLAAALGLEPDNALVLSFAASQAASQDRLAEAIELQRRSVEADPLTLASRWNLATWLYMAGHLQEAETELLHLQELNPAHREVAARLGKILILESRFAEALELSGQMAEESDQLCTQALAYLGLGREADSDAALQALIRAAQDHHLLCIAEVYARRGAAELAFTWLYRSIGRSPDYGWYRYSPFLRDLRTDARWTAWLDTAHRYSMASTGARNTG